MARNTTVSCDATGCRARTDMTLHAGSLAGWLRRDISDSVNKRLAEGMRDFGASTTLYLCPKHATAPDALLMPPLHPDVAAFLAADEPNVKE